MKPLIDQVDPFFGVNEPGNCLVGPYRPFGLVRLGPDTEFMHHGTTGYRHERNVVRFSHTHVAGTGGAGRYGNLGVTPFVDGPQRHAMPPYLAVPPEQLWHGNRDEAAALGYYAVTINHPELRCELTSTDRVGLHRYRYPAGREAWFLFDAGAVAHSTNCALQDG